MSKWKWNRTDESDSVFDSLPQTALLRLKTSQSCLTLSSLVLNTRLMCCGALYSAQGEVQPRSPAPWDCIQIKSLQQLGRLKNDRCANRLQGTSLYWVFCFQIKSFLVWSRCFFVWFLSVASFQS